MKRTFLITLFIATLFVLQINAQEKTKEFYRTSKGEKFHKKECKIIKDKKALKVTLKVAKKKGLVACRVCNPLAEETVIVEKKPTKKAKRKVAVRCMGFTLKGKRCKRMTKNANERCYQHQE